MARPGVTAEELEESVLELIESLKYNPIPLKTSVLDYTGIKLLIAQSLYSTATWPSNTLLIDKVLQGNITDEIAQAWEKTITVTPDMIAETLGLYGIHCSDRFARASSLEEFMPAVEKLHSTSVIMGDNSDALSMTCAEWKFEAKERYDGDFQVATKNPVLFIGNTYDGHTPIASAFNVSSGFEDSVVLEVNGYGVRALNPFSLHTVLVLVMAANPIFYFSMPPPVFHLPVSTRMFWPTGKTAPCPRKARFAKWTLLHTGTSLGPTSSMR